VDADTKGGEALGGAGGVFLGGGGKDVEATVLDGG